MVHTRTNPFLIPFSPWLDLQRTLGEGVMNTLSEGTRPPRSRGNLYQDDDGATWVAQLPGASAEGLELSVEGRVIQLQRKPADGAEDEGFEQKLRMPFDIDGDSVSAQALHGLLIVRLPKRVEAKGKRIEIR